jgi:uncharacterized protein
VGEVSFYLDASILVALLVPEPFSERADGFVQANPTGLVVSDFAAAEFASAMARRVRTRASTFAEASKDLSDFDLWLARSAERVEISAVDVALAASFLRRLDLPLRTPDALHIALAQRTNGTLVTFDERMAASARALRTPLQTP